MSRPIGWWRRFAVKLKKRFTGRHFIVKAGAVICLKYAETGQLMMLTSGPRKIGSYCSIGAGLFLSDVGTGLSFLLLWYGYVIFILGVIFTIFMHW